LLERVCRATHLAQKLAICDGAALTWLVSFVDDGWLVGILDRMAIDTVVGGIKAASKKPGDIAIVQGPIPDGGEIFLESEKFACKLAPELVRVSDRFLVKRLVLVEVFQVCFAGALVEVGLRYAAKKSVGGCPTPHVQTQGRTERCRPHVPRPVVSFS